MDSSKIFVLAGSRREYGEYISDLQREAKKERKRFNSDEYRYIYGPNSLRGIRVKEVVRIGSWYKRPDISSIEEIILKERGKA